MNIAGISVCSFSSKSLEKLSSHVTVESTCKRFLATEDQSAILGKAVSDGDGCKYASQCCHSSLCTCIQRVAAQGA